MIHNIPFPARPPVASSRLPLTLISLEDWALVVLEGPDTIKYLQGQVTADVNTLAADQHLSCGHCDAKGKMWSILRLFHRGSGVAYLERRSVLGIQLAAIKKYAVFSRVTINADNNAVLLGVAGFQARAALASAFSILPNANHQVVQEGEATLLQFTKPAERFLLVTNATAAAQIVAKLYHQAELNDSGQWLALDIEAGYPIIDSANIAHLTPQAANLQALQGISFCKGCYTGQETVARARFRGANKRALYWLEGKAARTPFAAECLALQLGESWRRAGIVLAASTLADGTLWVQAVINNNLNSSSKLRVHADASSHLAIKPLPYKLES